MAAGVAPPGGSLSPESTRLAELQQRLAEQGAVVSGLQGENASLRAELERQRTQAAEMEGMLMVGDVEWKCGGFCRAEASVCSYCACFCTPELPACSHRRHRGDRRHSKCRT